MHKATTGNRTAREHVVGMSPVYLEAERLAWSSSDVARADQPQKSQSYASDCDTARIERNCDDPPASRFVALAARGLAMRSAIAVLAPSGAPLVAGVPVGFGFTVRLGAGVILTTAVGFCARRFPRPPRFALAGAFGAAPLPPAK